ncbi:MBL fold metallo-hydrolase [Lachnospiraceae bacterium C1.1]|nr:MBL fold metallo-hydrolase [Lachnospiraceae bacterium C1.1]
MNNNITFIPLGGGQRVGASCYYLNINGANVILDAGTGVDGDIEFKPDFHSLKTSPFVQSMSQINQIFISHAHMDHIGSLLNLMCEADHASVYMTEITRALAGYQLYDRAFIGSNNNQEESRLAAKSLLEKVAPVSFMQTMDFGRYKVTFYPAGHIPGAMMMMFEIGKRKVLYTGDYSLSSTMLTQGCTIPEGLNIDTMIMCGLHAKHPEYSKKSNTLYKEINYILRCVEMDGQSICCRVSQLSKGIEFLKALNEWNTSQVPIYLDASVMTMIEKMERLSVPILNQNNRPIGEFIPREPHIYITSRKSDHANAYRNLRVDFSLHEDFSDMSMFIKKLNPKLAVIVHCGKENSVFDQTIEQEMMLDGDCRTQFIFAEDSEIYQV